jgi:tRNA (cytidine/uridine-2'-O-)-methyltransferase
LGTAAAGVDDHQGATAHTDFQFQRNDVIMMGRETSGAPDWLHARADARLIIPMMPNARSLNMAVAAGLVVGEALRQTKDFPNTMPQTPVDDAPATGNATQ